MCPLMPNIDKRYILGSQIHRGLKMKQNKWKTGCIPIWTFKRHYCNDYLLDGFLICRFSIVTGCNRAEHSPRIRWMQWWIHGGYRHAAEPPLRPHAAGQWEGGKRAKGRSGRKERKRKKGIEDRRKGKAWHRLWSRLSHVQLYSMLLL